MLKMLMVNPFRIVEFDELTVTNRKLFNEDLNITIPLQGKHLDVEDKIIRLLNEQQDYILLNILNIDNCTVQDIVAHIVNLTSEQKEYILLKLL
jgi:hypothetical protein